MAEPDPKPPQTRDVREGDAETHTVARGGLINAVGNILSATNGLFLAFISWTLGAEVLGSYILADSLFFKL